MLVIQAAQYMIFLLQQLKPTKTDLYKLLRVWAGGSIVRWKRPFVMRPFEIQGLTRSVIL
jgi:hypothetical protein